MYNGLVNQLEQARDISVNAILSKIRSGHFDKEVLAYMDNITDYIAFYEEYEKLDTALNNSVSFLLVLNKLTQLPSYRTSRYL